MTAEKGNVSAVTGVCDKRAYSLAETSGLDCKYIKRKGFV